MFTEQDALDELQAAREIEVRFQGATPGDDYPAAEWMAAAPGRILRHRRRASMIQAMIASQGYDAIRGGGAGSGEG